MKTTPPKHCCHGTCKGPCRKKSKITKGTLWLIGATALVVTLCAVGLFFAYAAYYYLNQR